MYDSPQWSRWDLEWFCLTARSTDCGLRTAACGLRTADCGLRTAACGLRTADCGLKVAEISQPRFFHQSCLRVSIFWKTNKKVWKFQFYLFVCKTGVWASYGDLFDQNFGAEAVKFLDGEWTVSFHSIRKKGFAFLFKMEDAGVKVK